MPAVVVVVVVVVVVSIHDHLVISHDHLHHGRTS
jgi:hypothetical protein